MRVLLSTRTGHAGRHASARWNVGPSCRPGDRSGGCSRTPRCQVSACDRMSPIGTDLAVAREIHCAPGQRPASGHTPEDCVGVDARGRVAACGSVRYWGAVTVASRDGAVVLAERNA
jgi:hypothetical protein